MKTKLLVIMFFAFNSAIGFGQAAEKEAILNMVNSATEAYMKGNIEQWQSFRIKNNEASTTFVSNTGYNYIKGWDSIKKAYVPYLKRMSEKTSSVNNVKISNPIIKVNGSLAWIEFRQVMYTTTKDTTQESYSSNEMRVLNKENGKWKILTQITTITTRSTNEADVENTLNGIGYKLLSANKINDAIEVYKLNVKLNSNSWNVYDSLGEAYALAGNNDLAKENFEASIRLNPGNDNAVNALKKLAKQ